MKMRLKIASANGQHAATVVDEEGNEHELVGCSKVKVDVAPGDVVRVTAEFIEFDLAIQDIRKR